MSRLAEARAVVVAAVPMLLVAFSARRLVRWGSVRWPFSRRKVGYSR